MITNRGRITVCNQRNCTDEDSQIFFYILIAEGLSMVFNQEDLSFLVYASVLKGPNAYDYQCVSAIVA